MRISFSIVATLLFTFQTIPAPIYTPQNLIIATDLDDVVLQKKWIGIAGTVIKNIFSLNATRKAYKQFKKENPEAGKITDCAEPFYIYLLKKNQYTLATKVKTASTCKELIKGTVNIIKDLANQGFAVYSATNIGSLFYAEIASKYPDVFNKNCIRLGMTVDYTVKDVVKKPDPRYFKALKTKLNPTNDKQILFIDDKLENVEAARKAGLLAIHFKGHKQLRSALHEYGICVCS